MKKHNLYEELLRMKQLAGILKENESNIVNDVQNLINNNQFLKGNNVTPNDLIVTDKYILYVSDESLNHIKERHSNPNKPGSIINPSVNLKQAIKNIISNPPSEISGGRVKWLEADSGMDIGFMGVSKSTPEEIANMMDYTMPDGKKEVVKIAQGQRTPTKSFNIITSEIGEVEGKKVLSLITAFPGESSVDGVVIPMDRSEMSSLGLYFVVDKLPS